MSASLHPSKSASVIGLTSAGGRIFTYRPTLQQRTDKPIRHFISMLFLRLILSDADKIQRLFTISHCTNV